MPYDALKYIPEAIYIRNKREILYIERKRSIVKFKIKKGE